MTTDHAATVREAITTSMSLTGMPGYSHEDWDAALAALDALVAERDEARQETERWRRANGEVVGMIAHFVGSDVEGVDDMRAQLQSVLDAVREDAEADRDTLAAALREYADHRNWGIEREGFRYPRSVWIGPGADSYVPDAPGVARAALASVSPPTQPNPAA